MRGDCYDLSRHIVEHSESSAHSAYTRTKTFHSTLWRRQCTCGERETENGAECCRNSAVHPHHRDFHSPTPEFQKIIIISLRFRSITGNLPRIFQHENWFALLETRTKKNRSHRFRFVHVPCSVAREFLGHFFCITNTDDNTTSLFLFCFFVFLLLLLRQVVVDDSASRTSTV